MPSLQYCYPYRFDMVTTFLTHEDYSKSAKSLDDLRLKKQCVEAFQLLNVLDDLHEIAKILNLIECPKVDIKDLSKQERWVKLVWNEYKKLPFYYYYCYGSLMKCDRNADFFIIDKTYIQNKHFYVEDDIVNVSITPKDYRKYYDKDYRGRARVEKKFFRNEVIIKDHGDRIIKLGYANHPAARMWLTYEDSLIAYINAHLDEYYFRNNKDMNIPRYKVNNEVRPWWIKRDLIYSHQASLVRKNREYYKDMFILPEIYHRNGYIWPALFNYELAEDLVNEKFNRYHYAPIGGSK